uniref:UPAR/Ly6 domain-containing protein n=2 Tax=Caenorhabditis tropicalis TaxID=1561998 RepID=A0A1I7UV26_9PELO
MIGYFSLIRSTMEIRILLTILAFVGVATSLTCHSCDSFLSCERPFPVNCPPHSKCYTLTKNGNEVIAKGCAHTCESLSYMYGSHCQTCHHQDFCNSDLPSPGIGQGVVMRQQPPQIGGGVAPDTGYKIGHGVRPRSATQASFGMFMALPVIRRFVF